MQNQRPPGPAVSHRLRETDDAGNVYRCLPDDPRVVGRDATVRLFLRGVTYSCTACMVRNIFKAPDPARQAHLIQFDDMPTPRRISLRAKLEALE